MSRVTMTPRLLMTPIRQMNRVTALRPLWLLRFRRGLSMKPSVQPPLNFDAFVAEVSTRKKYPNQGHLDKLFFCVSAFGL